MELQSFQNESETGSVDILSIRPVNKHVPEPPSADFVAEVQKIVTEGQKQTLQAVAQVAKHVAEEAVRKSLNSSGASVVGAFHAIGILLAIRFTLLLSLGGAFALAVMAMQSQSYQSIGILVSFVALTVLPLVYLDRSSRRNSQDE